MTRPQRLIVVCRTTALLAYPLQAKISLAPTDRMFWIAATSALAARAGSDIALHQLSTDHRTHAFDRWAQIGDGLGAGKHLMGATAGS